MTGNHFRSLRIGGLVVALLTSALLVPAQAQLPVQVLDDPTPQADAAFGQSLAIVGDINGDGKADVLVGAPGQSVNGLSGQGQAFVFSGANQQLLFTLNDPTAQAGAGFGTAVAAIGDVDQDGYPDLLVGAPGQIVGGPQNRNGQAFVFSGRDGHLLYTINAPGLVGFPGFGTFGSVVAGIGDVDGDGRPDLAVGWIGGRLGLGISLRGHSAVFSGVDGHLLYSFPNNGPQVAAAGDVDGDGRPDVLIGTPRISSVSSLPTHADVFSGATGLPLLNFSPTPGAFSFGAAVAGVGDVDGDGHADQLVGTSNSQAYLFSGNDGHLLRTFTNPVPQNGGIGAVLAAAGDLNGDGVPDMAITAPDAGQVLAFSGKTGALLRTLSDPVAPETSFGTRIGGGDVNADGFSDLVIGAPGQTVAGNSGQGEAFVFLSPMPVAFGLQPSAINPRANGVITITLHSTSTLKVSLIDVSSLRFGPAEAHVDTFNGNAPNTLVLHFRTQNTGIACGAAQATLTGMTITGSPIQGSASFKTAGCQ